MSTLLLWTAAPTKFQMFLCTSHPNLWCFEICVNTNTNYFASSTTMQSHMCCPPAFSRNVCHSFSNNFSYFEHSTNYWVFWPAVNVKTPLNREIDILMVQTRKQIGLNFFCLCQHLIKCYVDTVLPSLYFLKSYLDPCGIIDSLQLTDNTKKNCLENTYLGHSRFK